jgi:hypothetical protein
VFERKNALQALHLLGQDDTDIQCVYCGREAQTWDHLIGLVRSKKFSGHGHVLGNLVPCCKACNSAKGNREWSSFLRARSTPEEFSVRSQRIQNYQRAYRSSDSSYERIRALAPEDFEEYEEIERKILNLMLEADVVAARIRRTISEQ